MVVNLNWSGNQVKDKPVLPWVIGVGMEFTEEEQVKLWLELCAQVLATASPHPFRPANWFYPQPHLDVSSCSHNKSPSSCGFQLHICALRLGLGAKCWRRGFSQRWQGRTHTLVFPHLQEAPSDSTSLTLPPTSPKAPGCLQTCPESPGSFTKS